MDIVCFNGEYLGAGQGSVPISDQGVLYGIGIFETIRVSGGSPLVLERHLSRLFASAGELGLKVPFGAGEIEEMLCLTAKKNGMEQGGLRLTLTGGGMGGPSMFIQGRPLTYREDQYHNGLSAAFSSIRRNEGSPLVRHKTLNYFENIMARGEAVGAGWDEALFLNNSGSLAEGAVSNIFLVAGGKVKTPHPRCGLLPGITRRRVLEECSCMGISVEEKSIHPGELSSAEESFITNALMGVMPLTRIGNGPVGSGMPGEITLALMTRINR